MKKILASVLLGVIGLSMVGCKKDETAAPGAGDGTKTSAPPTTTTPTPEAGK